MDRRSFLTKAAVGGTAAAAATTLAAPLYAQGRRTLTMVTSWGRGGAGVHDSAMRVANSITAMTDGQVTIDLKAAGELVGAFEVFDAVTAGQADMYHSADYYWVGQHPAYAFFTAVPFGMTAQELANWYYHKGGMALHDEVNQIFGLKGFFGGNTGAQAGGWFRREITSAADFNGLRFRMPGLGGVALGKLGASVQNIPGGEVYQALASGALDGTEWIGPWSDEMAGFQEITQFYYAAGFHEPGAALAVALSRDVFDSLTPAQQKVVEIACGECHQWSLAQFLANNGSALARLRSGGVQVKTFPDDVWDAFGRASNEVHAENMGDPLYKRVFDSFSVAMRESSAWIEASEGTYRAQRDRVLG